MTHSGNHDPFAVKAVAQETMDPPADAQFVHGSGATRWYTARKEIDYAPIDTGDELTILNLYELALMTPTTVNTVDVHGSEARGVPLLTNGTIGADMLYVPPGKSFPYHVHDGHHLLLSVGGIGSVTFAGKVHIVRPGDLYMIEATVPHAVGADGSGPGHWLISFGSPHARVDSHDRMTEVEEYDRA